MSISSPTFSINFLDTELYWSSAQKYLKIYDITTLTATQSKESFSMNTIIGGNGKLVYFISTTTNKYLQWITHKNSQTASIINSSYDGDTEWDKIPASDQASLTFHYNSVKNGFQLQTLNKNGKYLKKYSSDSDGVSVNYILCQFNDPGTFTKQSA